MENNSKTGAFVGGALGVFSTIMCNPLGKFVIFTAQDEVGLSIHKFIFKTFNNYNFAIIVTRFYNTITNLIMAYPVILPVLGGVVFGSIGAIIGKKIEKSKLKRTNLNTNKKVKTLHKNT